MLSKSNVKEEFWEKYLKIKLDSCYFQMWITRECNSRHPNFNKNTTILSKLTTIYDQSILDELEEIRCKFNIKLNQKQLK